MSVFRRRDSRVEPWFPEALPRGFDICVPKYLTPKSLIYIDLLFICYMYMQKSDVEFIHCYAFLNISVNQKHGK